MISVASSGQCWALDLGNSEIEDMATGSQGQMCAPFVTESQCGAQDLSAYRVILPAGARATPHTHGEDRIATVRRGYAATLMMAPGADAWQTAVVTGPGDLLFIPAGWVHQAVTLGTQDVQAVEVSGSTREDTTVLTPQHDEPRVVDWLRAGFAKGSQPVGVSRLPAFS